MGCEAGQRRPLPLYGLVQLDVGHGQGRLVGEGRDQGNLQIGERADFDALHHEDAARLTLAHERDSEERPEANYLLHLSLAIL